MGNRIGRAFLIVAALQALAILAFAAERETRIQTGREYLLETRPVDPRDVFRGDYVVLGYTISTLNFCCYQPGETIYVLLEERNGVWQGDGHAREAPRDGQPFIRGQVMQAISGLRPQLTVNYGIESYFVPEGQGRELERQLSQTTMAPRVRIRVDASGAAIIKELVPAQEQP